jgi:hypothetical protein
VTHHPCDGDQLHDPDHDVTRPVFLKTDTQRAIAAILGWPVTAGTTRLCPAQEQQMRELVAMVGTGECQGCDSGPSEGSRGDLEGRERVPGGLRGLQGNSGRFQESA